MKAHSTLPAPSNRSFGWTFTAFFLVLAGTSFWRGGTFGLWWVAIAGSTAAITLVRPGWLAPLNRWWMRLAEWLQAIVNPIVIGLLFFGAITPLALVMRLAGRDPLARVKDPDAATYWVERNPPGPEPNSLKDQF